jgi:CRISPR type III-A-associated protein Csm2
MVESPHATKILHRLEALSLSFTRFVAVLPGVQDLVEILDAALEPVIRETDKNRRYTYFRHFVEFFEAILAYHKAYGGN